MNIGDIVRRRDIDDDIYGIVEYSIFGYSIHFWDEKNNAMGNTLGTIFSDVNKYWEVVDLPDDYEINEIGLPEKIK